MAQFANFRGIILSQRPVQVSNDEQGFEYLLQSIRRFQEQFGIDDVIVGMESTGHYFFNLANWLIDREIEVVLVNPATTSRNKENRDNTPSKSDPKDAAIIADLVSRGYYSPYRPKKGSLQRINILVRARERIVRDMTRTKNRIYGWLDVYFPEYLRVFKDPFCRRSLATLRQMPTPTDVKELSAQEVVQKWEEDKMVRPGGARGLSKAAVLLRAARHSVGSCIALEEAKWELERLVKDYERQQEERQEVEDRIKGLLHEVPQARLLETTGLPPLVRAVLLACAGDLGQLEHGNQLLRMAGMNLAEKSSGKYKGKIKLSKRGNPLLRKYLYLAVLYLVGNTPVFRMWHEHNVQVKRMSKMGSLIKLIGKLARILVAMARKKEPFSVEKAQHLAA
uniref:IS110 family transposase n=1 Tax=Alicyclobacillus tolerans TaxID=90970 RepID=UPI004037E590